MTEPERPFETGTFRVDRRRALEKLMRFQLAQPELFVLPWIRCAVASGATWARVDAEAGRLALSFDGLPFSREDLVDPYSCLFEREDAARRRRELAVGLLSALRLSPRAVSIAAGPLSLTVMSLGDDRLDGASGAGDRTVITFIEGPGGPPAWTPEVAQAVARRCAGAPLRLSLDGDEVRPPWAGESALRFRQDESVHGWARVPRERDRDSLLDLSVLGVVVETARVELPRVQIEGCVNDDAFPLDASQSAVARTERYAAALSLAERKASELLAHVIEEQPALLARVGAAVKGRARALRRWRQAVADGAAPEGGALQSAAGTLLHAFDAMAGRAAASETIDGESLARVAPPTLWLRDAASRLLSDREKDAADPLLAGLWTAPLELATSGGCLSLADLDGQARRLGFVPVTERLPEHALKFSAVWLAASSDADVLVRRFPGLILDVSEQLEQAAAAAPGGASTLEQAGVQEVAVRGPLHAESCEGEIGLSLEAGRAGARLHVARPGGGFDRADLAGPLRFEAVVAGAAPDAEVLRAAALPLYEKLVGEYDCWRPGERNAAVRRHLLDALVATRALPPNERRWIDAVPLFDCVDSWIDYDRLFAALQEDRPVFVAPERRAGPAGERLRLVGPLYDDAFLRALLPDALLLPARGLDGVRVLVSPPAVPVCAHAAGCLAARQLRGAMIHVAAGDGPGQPVELPWGRLRLLAPWALAPEDVAPLAGDYRLAVDVVSALVKRGTDLLQPSRALDRRLILSALRYLFAPWPGNGPERPRRHLLELLDAAPLWRDARGLVTLARLQERLAAGEDLSRLGVDEADAALFAALGERPAGPAKPAGETLDLGVATLFEGVYSTPDGLLARLGLPARPGPPSLTLLRGGRRLPWDAEPGFVGCARYELSGWKRPDELPDAEALQVPVERFYADLSDRWPPAGEGTPAYDRAVDQVLAQLRLAADPAFPPRSAQALRQSLFRLPLLRAVSGRLVSLADAGAAARERGALLYADGAASTPPPADVADAAVVASPARAAVVAAVLGCPARALADPPAPADDDGPAPDGEPPGLAAARELWRALRARANVRLPEPGFAAAVRPEEPLAIAVLTSSLPPRTQGAYLLVLASDAARRRRQGLSPADEARLLAALIAELER